ncbi:putative P450 monooxygenase [Xylariaceae sp. AK1471]|nr:putative P450 monooxygenase [Xylariaceae sp. AK1471]
MFLMSDLIWAWATLSSAHTKAMPAAFLVLLSVSLWAAYILLYRLYFCPIAHVPGPWLASATFWYEFYYDVIQRGRYEFKLQELHARHGPVIRINPREVHVADPASYEAIYLSRGKKIDKWSFSTRYFINTGSAIATVDHDHHRIRRNAIEPWFSKQTVRRLEPTLHKLVDRLMEHVSQAKDNGSVLNMTYVFTAFTADVITKIEFGEALGLLEDLQAAEEWSKVWQSFSEKGNSIKHFSFLGYLIRNSPVWLTTKLLRKQRPILDCFEIIRNRIVKVEATTKYWPDNELAPTLLEELIHGKLPRHEKQSERLFDECLSHIAAGSITTSEILSTLLFHIINQPDVSTRVRDELRPVMDRTSGRPRVNDLENLPFLTACVKEGLRLGHGVTQRLPRVHRVDLQLGQYIIPRGTPVSMSAMTMHMDPSSFENPLIFDPSRWLGHRKERSQHLFVPFSKGPRACAGLNLAWAELYLVLARLLGTEDIRYKLFETVQSDVEICHDFFVGYPKLNSHRVRVQVT